MTQLTIKNATLISEPGADARPGVSVQMSSGVITRISQGALPAQGEEYDAAGCVVVPGFWNCHVHLTEPQWAHAAKAPAEQLQAELDDMFLSRGFTTAVDLGSVGWNTQAVKSRVESDELLGPRIMTSGMPIFPVRGLPFYIRAETPWYLRLLHPQPRGPRATQRYLERSYRNGAEVAKIFSGSNVRMDEVKPLSGSVAQAAVELAHRQGRLVFAHASNAEGLRIALEAGVDVIAHALDNPDGAHTLLQEAARRGVWMVPTLDMFAQTASRNPDFLEPIYAGLNVFREAGGRLLFGTDVGYLPDRSTLGEYQALEECGLDVHQVLAMLAQAPAETLGQGSGRLAEGEPADLVILDHDQIQAPSQLADVQATIRRGRLLWHVA